MEQDLQLTAIRDADRFTNPTTFSTPPPSLPRVTGGPLLDVGSGGNAGNTVDHRTAELAVTLIRCRRQRRTSKAGCDRVRAEQPSSIHSRVEELEQFALIAGSTSPQFVAATSPPPSPRVVGSLKGQLPRAKMTDLPAVPSRKPCPDRSGAGRRAPFDRYENRFVSFEP